MLTFLVVVVVVVVVIIGIVVGLASARRHVGADVVEAGRIVVGDAEALAIPPPGRPSKNTASSCAGFFYSNAVESRADDAHEHRHGGHDIPYARRGHDRAARSSGSAQRTRSSPPCPDAAHRQRRGVEREAMQTMLRAKDSRLCSPDRSARRRSAGTRRACSAGGFWSSRPVPRPRLDERVPAEVLPDELRHGRHALHLGGVSLAASPADRLAVPSGFA